MNSNKQEHNWWIDTVLFTGYLLCFVLDLTGVVGHEWLGMLVGALGLVHLLVHWKWVTNVFKRFTRSTCSRNQTYLHLDILLTVGFAGILVTGLVISTWFNLDLSSYATWLDVHIYVSVVTLLVTLLKIGLHWRWVVNTTTRIFASAPKPERATVGLTLARQPVQVDESRRKFLAVMGVAGLGSTLALLNLTSSGSLLASALVNAAGDESAATPQPTGTVQNSEVTPEASRAVEATTETPDPTVTLEDSQVITETQPPSTVCTVRCNRGCSFPGHCRRYVDQDGNGKCDLGECM